MKPSDFFRRFAIFRTSLTLLIALIVGGFLTLSIIVSLYNGEWARAFKIAGMLLFAALLVCLTIAVGKAQTKRLDIPAD